MVALLATLKKRFSTSTFDLSSDAHAACGTSQQPQWPSALDSKVEWVPITTVPSNSVAPASQVAPVVVLPRVGRLSSADFQARYSAEQGVPALLDLMMEMGICLEGLVPEEFEAMRRVAVDTIPKGPLTVCDSQVIDALKQALLHLSSAATSTHSVSSYSNLSAYSISSSSSVGNDSDDQAIRTPTEERLTVLGDLHWSKLLLAPTTSTASIASGSSSSASLPFCVTSAGPPELQPVAQIAAAAPTRRMVSASVGRDANGDELEPFLDSLSVTTPPLRSSDRSGRKAITPADARSAPRSTGRACRDAAGPRRSITRGSTKSSRSPPSPPPTEPLPPVPSPTISATASLSSTSSSPLTTPVISSSSSSRHSSPALLKSSISSPSPLAPRSARPQPTAPAPAPASGWARLFNKKSKAASPTPEQQLQVRSTIKRGRIVSNPRTGTGTITGAASSTPVKQALPWWKQLSCSSRSSVESKLV